jgi:hypothetical protein
MSRGPRPQGGLEEAIPIAKAWAGNERAGADIRLSDRPGDPGHVCPDHVRAGNSRGHPAAC